MTEKLLTNSQQKNSDAAIAYWEETLMDENGVRGLVGREYTIFGNLGDTYTGLTGKTKEALVGVYISLHQYFQNSRIDIQTQSMHRLMMMSQSSCKVRRYIFTAIIGDARRGWMPGLLKRLAGFRTHFASDF